MTLHLPWFIWNRTEQMCNMFLQYIYCIYIFFCSIISYLTLIFIYFPSDQPARSITQRRLLAGQGASTCPRLLSTQVISAVQSAKLGKVISPMTRATINRSRWCGDVVLWPQAGHMFCDVQAVQAIFSHAISTLHVCWRSLIHQNPQRFGHAFWSLQYLILDGFGVLLPCGDANSPSVFVPLSGKSHQISMFPRFQIALSASVCICRHLSLRQDQNRSNMPTTIHGVLKKPMSQSERDYCAEDIPSYTVSICCLFIYMHVFMCFLWMKIDEDCIHGLHHFAEAIWDLLRPLLRHRQLIYLLLHVPRMVKVWFEILQCLVWLPWDWQAPIKWQGWTPWITQNAVVGLFLLGFWWVLGCSSGLGCSKIGLLVWWWVVTTHFIEEKQAQTLSNFHSSDFIRIVRVSFSTKNHQHRSSLLNALLRVPVPQALWSVQLECRINLQAFR